MRRWRRWGSIAMAGGWLHTVHSAHDQMEQFFCSDVSKMINKQWKHSEHRPGISTSNCLGWTMSFTLRIGYYTVKWLLEGPFGQNWYRNLRCEHMGVSSGQHFSKQITSRKCWSNYLFWTTSSATLSRYSSSPSDCIELRWALWKQLIRMLPICDFCRTNKMKLKDLRKYKWSQVQPGKYLKSAT